MDVSGRKQEIASSLPPFSDSQLEAMYRGLALASPLELSNPLLPPPSSAPALPDPQRNAHERRERLSLLERRLGELQGEMEEELGIAVEGGEEKEGLAERLRRSRGVSSTAMEGEEGEKTELVQKEEAGVPVEAYAPVRVLLERIAELLPAEEERGEGYVKEERGLAVPKGLLSRSEWTDLVLECVRASFFLFSPFELRELTIFRCAG
jgi:hypothetical protein